MKKVYWLFIEKEEKKEMREEKKTEKGKEERREYKEAECDCSLPNSSIWRVEAGLL